MALSGKGVETSIRKNAFGEYVVRLYHNGKLVKNAEYYTPDKTDAEQTAVEMIKRAVVRKNPRRKSIGKVVVKRGKRAIAKAAYHTGTDSRKVKRMLRQMYGRGAKVNPRRAPSINYAPGEYLSAYRLLHEAFGQEFDKLTNTDAALVGRDFMDARKEDDIDSREYARRIGRGNLQSYAEVMRVRARKGWNTNPRRKGRKQMNESEARRHYAKSTPTKHHVKGKMELLCESEELMKIFSAIMRKVHV